MALILLVLILCYAAVQVVGILKNVKITTDKLREVAELINTWAWKPVHLMMQFKHKWDEVQSFFDKKNKARKERNKKKKEG